jgi:hypothetical protein
MKLGGGCLECKCRNQRQLHTPKEKQEGWGVRFLFTQRASEAAKQIGQELLRQRTCILNYCVSTDACHNKGEKEKDAPILHALRATAQILTNSRQTFCREQYFCFCGVRCCGMLIVSERGWGLCSDNCFSTRSSTAQNITLCARKGELQI